MNIKEKIQNLSQQQKNIYYWVSVILFIDIFSALPHIVNFTRTGMCRNYMTIGSVLHSCSLFEFAKNGWAWISFADVCVFVPAALFMIMAASVLSEVLVKRD